jgi:hypothetical protein
VDEDVHAYDGVDRDGELHADDGFHAHVYERLYAHADADWRVYERLYARADAHGDFYAHADTDGHVHAHAYAYVYGDVHRHYGHGPSASPVARVVAPHGDGGR